MATTTLELTRDQKKLLKAIEKASASDPGFLMVDRTEAQPLYDAEQIIFNEAMTDGNKMAARVKTGVSSDSAEGEAEDKGEPVELHPFISGIPMADTLRTKKPEVYPFSRMGAGDSFLVPVNEKNAEPWRTFASTVSSANRRFKDAGKKFALRRVTKGDKYPNGYEEPNSGARVFRTV